ncbi:MAG TPA: glycosyltransferase [Candidatus Eisenbacteria bacterium]|nr:glycosyltransferase [Candidatus Eisenbacteria bacterium]
MSSAARVSFVVTCYNYGRFLGQALDSLLAQTLTDWEATVIDDASTDETGDVLARYAAEPRLRVVRHAGRTGNIRSYNEGLDLAAGRYVGILSADDYLLRPDALERQVAVFESDPEVGLVYSAHAIVQEGSPVRHVVPWASAAVRPGVEEFRKLMWGNYVLHSGALLRREVERELGPYDPALTHTGDWDMWLRAAARHPVGYVAEPLYAYRIHGSNMFHRGLPPWRETDQVVAAVDRAFACLPPGAPPDLLAARSAVRSHALLQTPWWDLHHGRRRRTWQGFLYALRRRPAMVASVELWRFLPRLLLMTAVGREPYRRATARLERLRCAGAGAAPGRT